MAETNEHPQDRANCPPSTGSHTVQGLDVHVRKPRLEDAAAFIEAALASRPLHGSLVHAPQDLGEFQEYLHRSRLPNSRCFLVERRDGSALVGVVNASEIVHGNFRSCYLGYYGFVGQTGQGGMTSGLGQAISVLFREERLHRVEANIQPDNAASRQLVQRLGFRLEGLSPRYLQIGGRWRDHERWALLADEHTHQDSPHEGPSVGGP